MKRAMDWKRVLPVISLIALLFALCVLSFGDVLMPETGKTKKKDGDLTIDCSHMDEGYVMIKGVKSKKKQKLLVKFGKNAELRYDLNSKGEYITIPLQYGNGKYEISL